jgi:hypothetical protein
MRALVVIALLAACSDDSAAPRLAVATPDHGPLVGGTTIVLGGSGFVRGAPVRVLIGGREAPLALATADTTLEVVIPPGDRPGDAEIIVLADGATTTSAHLFHYSAPPVIDAVSPAEVVHDSTITTVTITGRGFRDEAAGDLEVLVDGNLATGVLVRSDTTLTFTAPPGTAFLEPDVQVLDLRGTATKPRGFRYRPGPRGGLLMFSRFGATFATFFDPVAATSLTIPRDGAPSASFTTVVMDPRGAYWAFDRNSRWGRIDMRTQSLVAPIQTNLLIPTMVRMGTSYYAIERFTQRFGRFEPTTAVFTPIGAVPCCGSYGLATDGTTLWFTARVSPNVVINTIDPTTGTLGTPVTVTPTSHIEELRWFGGVLYGTTSAQTLLAIDPATGATTVMPMSPGRANAMEIVE